jgi:hypothetical protein
MTTVAVVEYTNLAADRGTGVPLPVEPGVAQGAVTIGAAAASEAFADGTKLVRLSATGACHVRFGTAPTATTDDTHIPAGGIVDFWVRAGSGLKVSVISAA